MYIKITKDIVDAAISGDQRAIHLLEDMEFAYRHGKHFFLGDRDTLSLIGKHFGKTFIALSNIINHISELGPIAARLTWRVEFSLSDEVSRVDSIDNVQVIRVSKNDINLFQVFSECHLLAENLDDIEMYSYILNYYKREHGSSKLHNVYYPILGGGSTTAMVLKHEMDMRQSLVFCIVDSDKIHSGASLKETAKKVEEEYNKNPYKSLSTLYKLCRVMEVENLIPFHVLESYGVINKNKDYNDHLAVIKKIKAANESYLDFFDFKKGISDASLIDESPENKNSDIMASVCEDLVQSIEPNRTSNKKILEILSAPELAYSPQQREKTAGKCMNSDTYISGLEKEILHNVLEHCKGQMKQISKEQLSKTQSAIYEELGMLMFNWTITSNIMTI